MKLYVTLTTLSIVALAIFGLYIFYKQQSSEKFKDENKLIEHKVNWKIRASLLAAFLLILISGISPLLFTSKAITHDFDFTGTGQIGDTIGGLTNPFIALAGVIITGLAFYVQYRANKQQLDLFHQEQNANKNQLQDQINNQKAENRIQQFESQFYEMLRLHRENVAEMEIEGYNFRELPRVLERYEKTTKGRKVFVVMKTEFECILAAYAKDGGLNRDKFHNCYRLFFSGLEDAKNRFPQDDIIEILKKARKRHEEPESHIVTNAERKQFLPHHNLYFNYKPFSGHASRLGHYFRHLYFTVKSVATSDIITEYNDRMKYLRILRAQLSNHEQILLFYNWLSGYGEPWENDEHQFFTEYCMIHNLWHDTIFQDSFIKDNVNSLQRKEVRNRRGPMFEIDY